MEDGIRMQPGIAPIIGRQKIVDGLAGSIKLFNHDQKITIAETKVSGDGHFLEEAGPQPLLEREAGKANGSMASS